MGLWYLAHILGFTFWLGGGAAAMVVGIRGGQEDRATQAVVVRLLAGIHRSVILPGLLLAVISGLYLSVRAAQVGAHPTAWLMLMQGAGLVAAILVLFISLPTLGRLTRISPTGDTSTLFDALRKRQRMAGMIAGILGLLALLGGVLHKY